MAKQPKKLPEGTLVIEKGKRRTGRPSKKNPVLTPELVELIGDLYMQAVPLCQIARQLGVHPQAVRHHIDTTHRPRWHDRATERFEEELAKVEYLERIAWQRFHASLKPETSEQLKHLLGKTNTDGKRVDPELIEKVTKTVRRTGEVCWLDIVKWCRDYFAKVGGYYQADPLGDTTQQTRPIVMPILVTTREQANKALTFEDLQRAARENNAPGSEVLDAEFS